MRVVIIGASHAGLTTAKNLKELKADIEVVMIDKQPESAWGFFSSGVNYGLLDEVKSLSDLTTKVDFLGERDQQIGNATVVSIDKEAQTIDYLIGKRKHTLGYDRLVLAMGSGIFDETELIQENRNVLAYKNLAQSEEALPVLKEAQTIAIIGSGYIALELADTLVAEDKKVHIIDSMSNVLFRYFDEPISQLIDQAMTAKGVLYHGQAYNVKFETKGQRVTAVNLENEVIPVDAVVTPLPAFPNTFLLEGVVDLHEDLTVKVNHRMETSAKNIYAVGDIVPLKMASETRHIFLSLVDRAVRTGRTAALNIAGLPTEYGPGKKVTASKIFGYFLGSCGVTYDEAPFYGVDVAMETLEMPLIDSVLPASDHPEMVTATLVYAKSTHQVVGLQLFSQVLLKETLNVASCLIGRGITIEELSVEEFLFMPSYTGRFHLLNELAFQILPKIV